jgi:copper transport protein
MRREFLTATANPLSRLWLLAFARLLLMLAMIVGGASAVLAHAVLLQSQPADGAVVAESPRGLTLSFNEAVTPFSVLIIDPSGETRKPTAIISRNGEVTISLDASLPVGTSLLSYRVISSDGHPVAGSIAFSVGKPSAGVAATDTTPLWLKAAIWLARVGFYSGLFFGVGGVFFCTWFEPDARRSVRADRLLSTLLATGLASAVAGWALQGFDATGLTFAAITSPAVWSATSATSYAWTLATGALAMLAALLAFRGGKARLTALLGFTGVGTALSLSGHASSAEPKAVMGLLVGLHGLCVAFWAGALPQLLAAIRRPDFRHVLLGFSSAAVPAVALLALTGAAIAWVQVGSPAALSGTAYGQLLAAKLVLVAALVGLALWNRLKLTPALIVDQQGAASNLRATIRAELVLVALILCVAAIWRFTPPPRALSEAAAQPAHLHIHTEQAMVDVTLKPGRAGPTGVELYFQTGDFAPLTPKEVAVRFSQPGAGVEAIERKAVAGPDGIWRAGPLVLQPPGTWEVRVDALITDFSKAILEDRIELRR